MVAAINLTFNPLRHIGADRAHLSVLDDAQHLGLELRVHVADLVEQQGAAVGLGEQPAAGRGGAGKGAANVAKELALEQLIRQRGAVDRHERRIAARPVNVDGARDELLAGSTLAADQHRRGRHRDAFAQIEHLLHSRAAPDHACRPRALARQTPQLAVLAAQRSLRQRPVDVQLQLVQAQGLGHVVVGAALDRLDRGVDGAERGHHDHRHLGVDRARCAEHVEAVDFLHAQIGDDQIGQISLGDGDRLGAAARHLHLVAQIGQLVTDDAGHLQMVVDDQDPPLFRHTRSSGASSQPAPVHPSRAVRARNCGRLAKRGYAIGGGTATATDTLRSSAASHQAAATLSGAPASGTTRSTR